MKKRNLLFILVLLISLTLMACGSDSAPETQAPSAETEEGISVIDPKLPTPETEETTEVEETEEEGVSGGIKIPDYLRPGQDPQPVPVSEEDVLVKVEEIEYEIIPNLEPDFGGEVLAPLTIINRSKYPIREVEIRTNLETEFDIHYFQFYTIMPGNTSSTTYGPYAEDMEITSIRYVVYDGQKNIDIIYDIATGEYSQMEDDYRDINRVEKDQVLVPADFEISYETFPPDIIGTVYSDLTYTNNTKYTVGMWSLEMLGPETGEVYHFALFGEEEDAVAPGGTSNVMHTFGAEEMVPLTLLYTATVDGVNYMFSYDYQLDLYSQAPGF